MYKLPSDVYSPRCSPSGGENRIQGVAQLGRAPLLGSGGFFAGSNPVALIINEL